MASTPMLGLEDVDPFPVPRSPAMMQHTPSVKIPLREGRKGRKKGRAGRQRLAPGALRGSKAPSHLLMACTGGGDAPARRAQA